MLHARYPLHFPPKWRALLRPAAGISALFLAACSPAVYEEAMIAEPVVVEDAAGVIVAPSPAPAAAKVVTTMPRYKPATRTPRRGVITAGDIDDTLNYGAFQRYLAKARRTTHLPAANLSKPVLAQLVGSNGKPAPGVRITLRRPGAADPFYSGYSGVDGNITVFPTVLGAGRLNAVELRAFPDGQGQAFTTRITTSGGRKHIALPFAGEWKPEFLDLAFVVDTTGSMGDELEWLTRELRGIVGAARRSAPGVSIRYGLIVYRDNGDEYVVRNYGFTNRQSQMVAWLRKQQANGGGDYPEAAATALMAGASLDWRRGKGERLMFHIADAPPHDSDARTYLAAAQQAARKGVQIFGLGASGVAAESEYLMRQAAVQTNGRYLFLTDDSGVGYGHAEPTISCYRVTKLRDLMVRVLRSELSGHRIEAPANAVIRTVGSYHNGVCQN
ncbi:VWA domain-containing protein [Profundibacter amoris]|uniref:VWA domain-containing protein n=2 Tax=Profundibacter amoris TaxID=2171755 RepID=A0A347UKR4_9RHOB|nr:VWA domain-containing protein [Profundibacter amoris]